MGSGISLWIRGGHPDSADAQAFLKAHRYGADTVHDLARRPPSPAELDLLAKGLGGDVAALVDAKNPRTAVLFPHGVSAAPASAVREALLADGGLFKAPLLLTPRGSLAGFRELKWRAFLDVGKGRS